MGASMSVVQVYKAAVWGTKEQVCVCLYTVLVMIYSLVIFMKDAASCLFGFLEAE